MATPPIAHLVAFDELGQFVDRPGFDALLAAEGGRSPAADVLIMSHGWNNNLADATALYRDLLAQLDAVAQARPAVRPPGGILALGVIWPAKAWDEDEGDAGDFGNIEESVPAGALESAVYEALSPSRASPAGFRHDVLRVRQFLLDDRISGADRDEFLALLRRHSDLPTLAEDEGTFDPGASDESLEGLSLGGFSARDVFRVFTYWQMKKRAGVVGQSGVRAMIAAVQGRFPSARVHLIGHSFGCKVMLSAAAGPGAPLPRPVQTMVLLQGAVSFEAMAAHVGGTSRPGGYHAALDASRVDGPIAATFSRLDSACSRAYPLASRVAGQVGELEGLLDPFRALGAVGASGVDDALDHRTAMGD